MPTIDADPYAFDLHPAAAALLIVDMQRDFLEPGGFGALLGNDVARLRGAIAPTSAMLHAARAAGMAVIHTREGHRPDLSDLAPAKRAHGRLARGIGVAAALGPVQAVELPEVARARAGAYVMTATEGAALHLQRLRERPEDFDPDVRDRLIAGAMVPAAFVAQAQKFRRWYRDAVLRVFATVDVILAPATPCVAPMIGQKTFVLDGCEHPLRPNIGIYTQPISFIGLPVVAVPVPLPGGLPIGVQVIAAPWREDLALRVARVLERQGVVRAPVPPAAP